MLLRRIAMCLLERKDCRRLRRKVTRRKGTKNNSYLVRIGSVGFFLYGGTDAGCRGSSGSADGGEVGTQAVFAHRTIGQVYRRTDLLQS